MARRAVMPLPSSHARFSLIYARYLRYALTPLLFATRHDYASAFELVDGVIAFTSLCLPDAAAHASLPRVAATESPF